MNLPYQLYLQDCCAFLASLPRGTVDLFVTDPAYAALEKHRVTASGKARGTTTRLSQSAASSNDWFEIFPDSRYMELFGAAYLALAKDAHLYMMCAADEDQIQIMKKAGELSGFKFWKCIVWDKMLMGMGYHWRAQHEVILFFEKGKRKLNHLGWSDVIKASDDQIPNKAAYVDRLADAYERRSLRGGHFNLNSAYTGHRTEVIMNGPINRELLAEAVDELIKEVPTTIAIPRLRRDGLYPTEKPVELWARLIANSARPGQLVVDPFMGSGSSGEAALTYGCRFAGCDTSPKSIEVATKRMNRVWDPEAFARSF